MPALHPLTGGRESPGVPGLPSEFYTYLRAPKIQPLYAPLPFQSPHMMHQ